MSDLAEKEKVFDRAIASLFIAVDEPVAKDINKIVYDYVNHLKDLIGSDTKIDIIKTSEITRGKNMFKNALALLITHESESKFSGVAIGSADEARGYHADFIVWKRTPNDYEKKVVAACLENN